MLASDGFGHRAAAGVTKANKEDAELGGGRHGIFYRAVKKSGQSVAAFLLACAIGGQLQKMFVDGGVTGQLGMESGSKSMALLD